MEKPNVILLTIDTLRADRVGCFGHNGKLTPNMDRLAARGIRFDQAITGGSWTQAAFPVLLASSYASFFGGCLGPLAPERPSPIQAFAEDGYLTAGFVTSPLLGRNYGYQRGFHQFYELIPHESDPALRRMKGGERLLRRPFTHKLFRLIGQDLRPARLYIPAPELTEKICKWLEQARNPFFIWAHYMDVHWPYHLEESLIGPHEIARTWCDLAFLYRVNRAGEKMSPEQKAYFIQLYEKSIQFTDVYLGQLFEKISEFGLMNNTIIIIVSDHGEELLERRHWGHFEVNLYDEIIRVPLIIYSPADAANISATYPEGYVVQEQVRLLDIMPTVLNLCHHATLPELEGESLVPTWRKGEKHYYQPISISEMWRDHRHKIAIRTNEYKYIFDSLHPEAAEFYNLNNDPGELKNIISEQNGLADEFQELVWAHIQRGKNSGKGIAFESPEQNDRAIQRLRDLGYVD